MTTGQRRRLLGPRPGRVFVVLFVQVPIEPAAVTGRLGRWLWGRFGSWPRGARRRLCVRLRQLMSPGGRAVAARRLAAVFVPGAGRRP